MVTTTSEEFLSPEEVGERLGVSVYTVRRWIKTGHLRAFKPGKEYRVQASDLEEFIRAREVRPKVPSGSPLEPSFNDVLAEERRTRYQHSWRDYITQQADRIASQADSKGYAPGWILEIAARPRDITRVLFDNGVLGNRETFATEAEWRQSWEISDALEKLEQAVEQAWRAQMREAEKLEQAREAAAKLDSIWKRSKEADKSSEEALKDISDERSASA